MYDRVDVDNGGRAAARPKLSISYCYLGLINSEILTVMPGRWSNGHGAAPGSIPYHGRLSGPRKRIKRVKTKNYKLY